MAIIHSSLYEHKLFILERDLVHQCSGRAEIPVPLISNFQSAGDDITCRLKKI